MRKNCCQNNFCSLLTSEQRELLCEYCIRTTWRKGQEISVDMQKKYAILIESGLLACMTSILRGDIRTTALYVSADFLAYFAFSSGSIEPFSPGTVTCIKDSDVILFPMEKVRSLFMDNPEIAKYMILASNNQILRTQTYLHFVLQQNAYEALRYLLSFCKQHNVPRLTYDELAKISNLHRVTVTRAMKDILRSDDFRA